VAEGQILFNGRRANEFGARDYNETPLHVATASVGLPTPSSALESQLAYLYQSDYLWPTLTVEETLSYVARLRMPWLNEAAVAERIEEALNVLGLQALRGMRVGLSGAAGANLSDGERRRVSVATLLLHNPSVVLADEPTSALDAASAQQLVTLLCSAAHNQQRTVVMTLHQPRRAILEMLDEVMLLHRGRLVFHGRPATCEAFFERHGFPLPPLTSLADHCLAVLAGLNSGIAVDASARAGALADSFQRQLQSKSAVDDPLIQPHNGTAMKASAAVPTLADPSSSIWRFAVITGLLVARDARCVLRDHGYLLTLLCESLLVSLMIGVLFLHVNLGSLAGAKSLLAALYMASQWRYYLQVILNVYRFSRDMPLADHERRQGLYGPGMAGVGSYLASKFIVSLPLHALGSLIFIAILYGLIGLRPEAVAFGTQFLAALLLQHASVSLALLSVSLTPSRAFVAGQFWGNTVMLFTGLLAGWVLLPSAIPVYLRWLQPVSFTWHGYRIMASAEFSHRALTLNECAAEGGTGAAAACEMQGGDILHAAELAESDLPVPCLAIAAITAAFTLIAAVALHTKTPVVAGEAGKEPVSSDTERELPNDGVLSPAVTDKSKRVVIHFAVPTVCLPAAEHEPQHALSQSEVELSVIRGAMSPLGQLQPPCDPSPSTASSPSLEPPADNADSNAPSPEKRIDAESNSAANGELQSITISPGFTYKYVHGAGVAVQLRGVKLLGDVPLLGMRGAPRPVLLQPLTLELPAGELTAMLGPSGCGKTSLLRLLAGHFGSKSASGRVLFDGRTMSRAALQASVGWVPSFQLFHPTLTVRETLEHAAALRLRGLSQEARSQRVQSLLLELGLSESADTLVGSEYAQSISGGAKRRLGIALGLLTQPAVLAVDEATTGLDSATAVAVISALRRLAMQGKCTVLVTVHQPSSELCQLFDRVLVMAPRGCAVFFGRPTHVAAYLSSLPGVAPLAPRDNVGDVLIDLVAPRDGRHHGGAPADDAGEDGMREDSAAQHEQRLELMRQKFIEWAAKKWEKHPHSPSSALALEGARDDGASVQMARVSSASSSSLCLSPILPPSPSSSELATAPFLVCCHVQLLRSWLLLRRAPLAFFARALQLVSFGLILTLFYARLGSGPVSVQSRVGLLQELTNLMFIGTSNSVSVFLLERNIFLQEYRGRAMGAAPFLVMYTAVELLLELLAGVLLTALLLGAIGMQGGRERFGDLLLVLICLVNCGESFGLFLCSLAHDAGLGVTLSDCVLTLFAVMSGLMSLQLPAALRGLNRLSSVGYSMRLLATNEFAGLQFHCDAGSADCPTPDGQAVLQLFGLLDGTHVANRLALVGLTVAYRLLACAAFKLIANQRR